MIILENRYLNIEILDPDQDKTLLGSRYCHGCSIWQVYNKNKLPLLSGPQFPAQKPDPFDGQGIPEVFETALCSFPESISESVLVIGVGEVRKTDKREFFHTRWNPEIINKCKWDIVADKDSVLMSTSQSIKGYALTITKKAVLFNETISTQTKIVNTGFNPLPVRWFAHPFFPVNSDLSCCRMSLPVKIPENEGFSINSKNEIFMNDTYEWDKGCYRSLEIPWNMPLKIEVFHALAKNTSISCNFNPTWLPIWANANTFSIEPFINRVVLPGSHMEWGIEYRFSSQV